ncbi:MAG: AAA family ATPase [Desulfobacterales bacterium]|nr:AAA family ATPase [Desulfobacterales bacterium]
MLKKDLLLQNPLMLMARETEDALPKGGFGAIIARAGVGKTSLMVQFALAALLKGKNVLHISLDDPVKKVSLWYEEIFSNIAAQSNLNEIHQLWETILPHRFIMTFRVEGFSVPKLEERLTDLTEQNIFFPQTILIDGLPFDKATPKTLYELKALAKKHEFHNWFTVRAHRYEELGPDGIPLPLVKIGNLFEVVVQLQPAGEEIHVKILKGKSTYPNHPDFQLDPETMLIKIPSKS